MTPRRRDRSSGDNGHDGRPWRSSQRGPEQSPDDYHVPYQREAGEERWRSSQEGPEQSPDDYGGEPPGRDIYGERPPSEHGGPAGHYFHPGSSPGRARQSGRRRDPYDYSYAGPYSTPPNYENAGGSGRRREERPRSAYHTPGRAWEEHDSSAGLSGRQRLRPDRGEAIPPGMGVEPEGTDGSLVGRGPRGYQRSPERIRDEVCERLTLSPYVDASRMEVDVDERGIVELDGQVDSRRTKKIAEDICDDVYGVFDVRNRLEIEP